MLPGKQSPTQRDGQSWHLRRGSCRICQHRTSCPILGRHWPLTWQIDATSVPASKTRWRNRMMRRRAKRGNTSREGLYPPALSMMTPTCPKHARSKGHRGHSGVRGINVKVDLRGQRDSKELCCRNLRGQRQRVGGDLIPQCGGSSNGGGRR